MSCISYLVFELHIIENLTLIKCLIHDFGRVFIKESNLQNCFRNPLKIGDTLISILTKSLSQTNFLQYYINKTKTSVIPKGFFKVPIWHTLDINLGKDIPFVRD